MEIKLNGPRKRRTAALKDLLLAIPDLLPRSSSSAAAGKRELQDQKGKTIPVDALEQHSYRKVARHPACGSYDIGGVVYLQRV